MRTVFTMDFPLKEYEERMKKLCEQMALARVDGVLITQMENLRYFTGLHSSDWNIKNAHVGALIVAADGRMALAAAEEYRGCINATCCLEEEEVLTFDPDADNSPYPSTIYSAMQRLGIDKGRIGLESGLVARLMMRYTDFGQLRRLCGDRVEWVRFAENIWNIRTIKSPAEVEIFRQVCDISGKCYQKAFDSVVLDKTTEREVYHVFAEEAFRLGADAMPPLIVEFGRGRYIQANCPPSDKVITSKKHEFLFLDTGPALKGYVTDTIRMAVVDSMNPRQKELWKMQNDALQFCLDMIKDGVPCYEVSAEMDKMVAARGFEPWNQTRGWTGHSLGLDIHEPPTLSCDCDMMIRSGMILSVEPLMMDEENGMIALEQNILVTENGYENLTPWLSEMLVL